MAQVCNPQACPSSGVAGYEFVQAGPANPTGMSCSYSNGSDAFSLEVSCDWQDEVCTSQSSVGVRYLKVMEIGRHPDTVGANSSVAAAVVAGFTAFDPLPFTCDAGCVHTGYPDPEDPSGVYYKDPPLPGPQYELFRGFMFDRTNTPCTGPGDAGTLSQASVGKSELSKPGDGSGPGGGTGGITKIDEAGTSTGEGVTGSAEQAQGLYDTMIDWLGSGDFVPSLPWSFEWSLPSGSCVDPSITWLGKTATWGLCDHPATGNFRMLWAWAFAMLAAYRVWTLALSSNS